MANIASLKKVQNSDLWCTDIAAVERGVSCPGGAGEFIAGKDGLCRDKKDLAQGTILKHQDCVCVSAHVLPELALFLVAAVLETLEVAA